jgi:uncharacterized membrane protein YqjE
MRVLWLLPKAAPALLRHFAAYMDLVAFDLEQSRRDLAQNLIALVIVGLSVFFAVMMGCAVVVALTWDTPNRVAAIAWMGGGFLALAGIAMAYRSKIIRAQAPLLDSVRKQWGEDKVILERILAEDKSSEQPSENAGGES